MTKDEALKLALEALESDYAFEWPAMRRPERSEKKRLDALTAIKEALAQPPLPVQREWVGLTDEDYEIKVSEEWKNGMSYAENKLKEKNFD